MAFTAHVWILDDRVAGLPRHLNQADLPRYLRHNGLNEAFDLAENRRFWRKIAYQRKCTAVCTT